MELFNSVNQKELIYLGVHAYVVNEALWRVFQSKFGGGPSLVWLIQEEAKSDEIGRQPSLKKADSVSSLTKSISTFSPNRS